LFALFYELQKSYAPVIDSFLVDCSKEIEKNGSCYVVLEEPEDGHLISNMYELYHFLYDNIVNLITTTDEEHQTMTALLKKQDSKLKVDEIVKDLGDLVLAQDYLNNLYSYFEKVFERFKPSKKRVYAEPEKTAKKRDDDDDDDDDDDEEEDSYYSDFSSDEEEEESEDDDEEEEESSEDDEKEKKKEKK